MSAPLRFGLQEVAGTAASAVTWEFTPARREALNKLHEANREIGRRQREQLLGFLQRYQAEHGWMPSVREIAAELGIQPSNAHAHLRILAREGKLVIGGGPRMIRLTSGEIQLR